MGASVDGFLFEDMRRPSLLATRVSWGGIFRARAWSTSSLPLVSLPCDRWWWAAFSGVERNFCDEQQQQQKAARERASVGEQQSGDSGGVISDVHIAVYGQLES